MQKYVFFTWSFKAGTVEARKLEYDCPPSLNQTKHQPKSSHIQIPTFRSLLPYYTVPYYTILDHTIPSSDFLEVPTCFRNLPSVTGLLGYDSGKSAPNRLEVRRVLIILRHACIDAYTYTCTCIHRYGYTYVHIYMYTHIRTYTYF